MEPIHILRHQPEPFEPLLHLSHGIMCWVGPFGGDEFTPPVVPFPHQAGIRAKASGVARSSARNFRQSPSVPRKVRTPLSAEMPAPVSIETDRAVEILDRTMSRVDPVSMVVG